MSACSNSKFFGKWSNIDCRGDSVCRDLTIQASKNIGCNGFKSCQNLNILQGTENVTCSGGDEDTCSGLNVNCTNIEKPCSFRCDGTKGCRNNKLNGIWKAIECKGISSCQDLYVEECIESIKCEETSSCQAGSN